MYHQFKEEIQILFYEVVETNVLKSIPFHSIPAEIAGIFCANNKSGTTIPLVSSWFKYRSILDKTGHFDQFQELQLENMF